MYGASRTTCMVHPGRLRTSVNPCPGFTSPPRPPTAAVPARPSCMNEGKPGRFSPEGRGGPLGGKSGDWRAEAVPVGSGRSRSTGYRPRRKLQGRGERGILTRRRIRCRIGKHEARWPPLGGEDRPPPRMSKRGEGLCGCLILPRPAAGFALCDPPAELAQVTIAGAPLRTSPRHFGLVIASA
jgi:hypothetical protein